MAGDTARAVQFFHELDRFSARFARLEFGEPMGVTHGGSVGSLVCPWRGAVVHFTADQDVVRVIRWFRRPESKVSAHLVVCDRKLGCHAELAQDLPLVRELPVTVIQCRNPAQRAWHARGLNGACYGIELVSAGLLRKNSEGILCSWRPRDQKSEIWSEPWTSGYKEAVALFGEFWEPFTSMQVRATIEALRHLRNMGAQFSALEPAWILGHDQVSLVKWDPGPTFPIHGVRSAIFDDESFTDQVWWSRYVTDPREGLSWRSLAVREVVREHTASRENSRDPSDDAAWSLSWAAWSRLHEYTNERKRPWLKLALYVLGYAVSGFSEGDFRATKFGSEDRESIRIFQDMAGCVVDGIAGPKTCEALLDRLAVRVCLGNVRPAV